MVKVGVKIGQMVRAEFFPVGVFVQDRNLAFDTDGAA